ncbi:MAG: PilZ domain-containing protein [Planctomycetes bacterium]|nr:PilZ domain-containing protein [Planctomycetota bacterium]
MGQERRIHKRYIVPGLRARKREKILFGLSSKPTSYEYPCLDISESGIQCATKQKLQLQNKILLDISIPTSRNKPIRAKAQVVWFKLSDDMSFGLAGLQFVSINKKQQAELKMMMEKVGNDKDRTTPYLRSKLLKSDTLFIKLHK